MINFVTPFIKKIDKMSKMIKFVTPFINKIDKLKEEKETEDLRCQLDHTHNRKEITDREDSGALVLLRKPAASLDSAMEFTLNVITRSFLLRSHRCRSFPEF